MKLTDIKIENFRGVRSLHLPLDGLTVLIGENNAGKSTVLEAIRLVLTRGFGVCCVACPQTSFVAGGVTVADAHGGWQGRVS
ncbi:MAG: AAA family ATPase [Candidatus Schekmanbacteria bacterium]|nr:AAA family ATPase [Candidatus Schekmanbacteria bacterium]